MTETIWKIVMKKKLRLSSITMDVDRMEENIAKIHCNLHKSFDYDRIDCVFCSLANYYLTRCAMNKKGQLTFNIFIAIATKTWYDKTSAYKMQ